MQHSIQYIPAEKIIETTECVYYSKSPHGASKEMIEAYLKTNPEYTRRATIMALELGFIKQENKLFKNVDSDELIKADNNQRHIIFRKYIQKFEPFILFVTLISKGNNIDDAIRKVKVIYDVASNEKDIRLALINWGIYSGLIDLTTSGEITLKFPTDKLSLDYLKKLVQSLESDIKTRIYLAEKLTEWSGPLLLDSWLSIALI